jgi:hypothetical protein
LKSREDGVALLTKDRVLRKAAQVDALVEGAELGLQRHRLASDATLSKSITLSSRSQSATKPHSDAESVSRAPRELVQGLGYALLQLGQAQQVEA